MLAHVVTLGADSNSLVIIQRLKRTLRMNDTRKVGNSSEIQGVSSPPKKHASGFYRK